MNISENHRAGFVSIVGRPNAGKSTLMNALVGERLSIITSKAQTTRHRITGIVNGDDFQIVYSDTPGIIKPKYELHKQMMHFVNVSFEDADLILAVTEPDEAEPDEEVWAKLKHVEAPVILILNKTDLLATPQEAKALLAERMQKTGAKEGYAVSAIYGAGTPALLDTIVSKLPVHPPYFDKEALTDMPERFFAAEIIREKIFLNYRNEIPYCCEVVIDSFKESDDIIRMRAIIYVERDSQKGILIGKGGMGLKKTGIMARKELEKFFGKQVHLEQHVKVEADWRTKSLSLKKFGYSQS